jgi:universal stress protein E
MHLAAISESGERRESASVPREYVIVPIVIRPQRPQSGITVSCVMEQHTVSEMRTILTIVEPENHPQEVVRRATWLAGLYDCGIKLLLCDPNIGSVGETFFLSNEAAVIKERIRAAQNQILDDLASIASDAGVSVETDILDERPIADGVLNRATDIQPLFIIKGTEFHSTAQRSIFVDTDWQLIRSCMFPLWLVKPHEMHDELRIVASVDPTHSHDKPAALDQIIIEAAGDVAQRAGGDVHLLHTYQRLIGIGHEATHTFKPIELPIDDLERRMREEHRKQLDALAGVYNIAEDRIHQLPGKTREILPTFVRSNNFDLVVMGAIARWGIKRAVIGSTAERVLDMLPCDVLIVRTSNLDFQ